MSNRTTSRSAARIDGHRPRIMFAVTSDLSLRLLRDYPEYLCDIGWNVHVVCSPGPILKVRAQNSPVHFHALKMRRNPAPLQDLRSLINWIRLCRRVQPDLLSVGTPKAGLLGGLAGVPRRVHLQRGLRMETSRALQRVVLGTAERIGAGVAHTVLAVSPSLKDVMVTLGLARAEKIKVIGAGSSNGVDVREFDSTQFSTEELDELRTRFGIRRDVQTIGYVGRLTRDKGVDILERAVVQLRDWGTDFNLLIVGGVDDPTRSATLKRLLNSGFSVASTGAVDDPAIYFQLMDLLSLPTYREGYPNVALEASASSKATVTTDATGAVDSVLSGITGCIVPRGDSDALARELRKLLADPGQLDMMGVQARQNVTAHFDRPEF